MCKYFYYIFFCNGAITLCARIRVIFTLHTLPSFIVSFYFFSVSFCFFVSFCLGGAVPSVSTPPCGANIHPAPLRHNSSRPRISKGNSNTPSSGNRKAHSPRTCTPWSSKHRPQSTTRPPGAPKQRKRTKTSQHRHRHLSKKLHVVNKIQVVKNYNWSTKYKLSKKDKSSKQDKLSKNVLSKKQFVNTHM